MNHLLEILDIVIEDRLVPLGGALIREIALQGTPLSWRIALYDLGVRLESEDVDFSSAELTAAAQAHVLST